MQGTAEASSNRQSQVSTNASDNDGRQRLSARRWERLRRWPNDEDGEADDESPAAEADEKQNAEPQHPATRTEGGGETRPQTSKPQHSTPRREKNSKPEEKAQAVD